MTETENQGATVNRIIGRDIPTDNRKLIEEAAKAIVEVKYPEIAWGLLSEERKEFRRRQARAALAVFEKALTPTDDEREALDYAIRCAIPTDLDYRPLWKLIRAIQDSVIAAGFRRGSQTNRTYPNSESQEDDGIGLLGGAPRW